MFIYQLKLVIKESKIDEFIECLHSLLGGLRKESGCLDFSFYRDLEKVNSYSLIGKWKTEQTMEKHFKKKNFSVLIGASKILSETFEMNIGDIAETGSFTLARKKITFQP